MSVTDEFSAIRPTGDKGDPVAPRDAMCDPNEATLHDLGPNVPTIRSDMTPGHGMDAPTDPAALLRIGFVVPRSNTVCERELNRLAPPTVGFHAARMRYAAGARAPDMSAYFSDKLKEPLEDLAYCHVDLTLLACSTATMALSPQARAAMGEQAKGGMIDVIEASLQALDHFGRPRTALFTPYLEAGTAQLRRCLEDGGVPVVVDQSLGMNTSPERFRQVGLMSADRLVAHVREMDLGGAEVLFLGCCDLPTIEAIPRLEAELGLPVISMIQAMFWAAMRKVAPRAVLPLRPGRLLAQIA